MKSLSVLLKAYNVSYRKEKYRQEAFKARFFVVMSNGSEYFKSIVRPLQFCW